MSNYKDIVGTAVRNNAGNLPSPETGQVWFDSTNVDFKYQHPNVTSAGSWRTGNNINTTRYYSAGAGASRDASLVFGGIDAPETSLTVTEYWKVLSRRSRDSNSCIRIWR